MLAKKEERFVKNKRNEVHANLSSSFFFLGGCPEAKRPPAYSRYSIFPLTVLFTVVFKGHQFLAVRCPSELCDDGRIIQHIH